MSVLITGGAGFIGSHFVRHWLRHYSVSESRPVVVLDALTYAGCRANLTAFEAMPGFDFVRGNVCDRPLLDTLLRQYAIEGIVHFAAESHVDRSIAGPAPFIQTNLVGTFTLLEAFRTYWESQRSPDHYRFLHISTDEVFGSLAPTDPPTTERSPYQPNSPYAASKAGSDHLVRAYHRTYGLPTLITSASNNYGPYQYPEKLIPLMILNCLAGHPLPVYGDGQQVRDWLHVADHCQALIMVWERGKPGEQYNIGGNAELPNLALVEHLCEAVDDLIPAIPVRPSRELITFVTDRPGHDRRYALDTSKIRETLGWRPAIDLITGLRRTVQWYAEHPEWWQPLQDQRLQDQR